MLLRLPTSVGNWVHALLSRQQRTRKGAVPWSQGLPWCFFAAFLLLATSCAPRLGLKQTPTAARITVYAFPLTASTRIPIDTALIQIIKSPLTLHQPAQFEREMLRVLSRRDTIRAQRFLPNYVRLLFKIQRPGTSPAFLVLDRNNAVRYQQRTYWLDRGILTVILRHLPVEDLSAFRPTWYNERSRRYSPRALEAAKERQYRKQGQLKGA